MWNQRLVSGVLVVVIACITMFSFAASVLAETKQPGATKKAPGKKQTEPQKPLDEMTCGDLTYLLGDEKRIDDSTYLMIWAYGVKTGAEGSDLKKNPFDAKSLEAFVKDLLQKCNKDSEAKFVPMITGAKEERK